MNESPATLTETVKVRHTGQMLLVITFVNGTNPKQAACVFEVVWLSWLSNASLFGLVFLLFGGDIIWPGCLYLTSHLKQNPAVFLDF